MKIQNLVHYFTFFLLLMLVSPLATRAQEEVNAVLSTADSLYEARQYTESLKLYEQILEEQQSPAMLLKMSFIEESMGDYSDALYYLNEYYLLTSDERATEKIQQLSEQHQLRGYEYSDYDLFFNILRRYQFALIYGLLALVMAGLVYFALRKRSGESAYGLGITFVILLGALFFLNNYAAGPEQAIITADNTYIMAGPSPGSKVVYISGKGHRVKVARQQDVWTEIEWNGEPAYVRQDNLRTLRL